MSSIHAIALRAGLLAISVAHAPLKGQGAGSLSPASVRERGIALFGEARYAESKRLLLPLGERSADAMASYYLGRIALQQDSADLADRWFEKARVDLDTSAAFHLWYARVFRVRSRHANILRAPMLGRQGKEELDRALQLEPDNQEARIELIHFFATAPRILGGDLLRARSEAERLRGTSPYQGGLQTAWVEERSGNNQGARRAYCGMVAVFPDSAASRVGCLIQLENERRYQDAFAMIDQRLTSAPADLGMQYQMGRLAAISGNWNDRGVMALQRFVEGPASETQSQLGAAHWRLGMLAEQRGDSSNARHEYSLAIGLDTTLHEPRMALSRLSRK